MTEDSLKCLSLDELYDLLVKTVNEYLTMHKTPHDSNSREIQKAELQLIQKAILERKNNLNPTR